MPVKKDDISRDVSQRSRRNPVVIGPLDIALFRLLFDYRFLRREHLSLLTGRPPTRLHRRLLTLVRAHYLKSIRHPQQKHIYTLSRAAAPVLVEEGLAGPEFLNARSRAHELTPFFLKHEMMIVDVHAILEVAAKSSSVRLTSWREGRELHEPLTVTDQFGVAKVHFSPDAFFTLDDSARPSGASRRHFFLEADRSKETHPQFREKFRAYRHYLERGLHEDRFGIKNFRVLTITRTEERAKNLCATAQSYLPERWTWKYFLFSSLERFDLQNARPILEAVHLRPGDVRQHALMPPVNSDEVTVV